MEEEFFHRVDKNLRVKLSAKLAAEAERQRLAEATGFQDEELLNELVAEGVSAEAVAAISLVPLVLAAWADAKMDAKERPSIVKAAKGQGIKDDSRAADLLEHWLDTKPNPHLPST